MTTKRAATRTPRTPSSTARSAASASRSASPASRKRQVDVYLVATAQPPSHDAIAQRAFELFMSRGGTAGNDVSDWLQAEAELQSLR